MRHGLPSAGMLFNTRIRFLRWHSHYPDRDLQTWCKKRNHLEKCPKNLRRNLAQHLMPLRSHQPHHVAHRPKGCRK
jgi:hypothetical protein